jgi:hypothetical protein
MPLELFAQEVKPQAPALVNVFRRAITLAMIARIAGLIPSGLKMQPGLAKYAEGSIREQFEYHVRQCWDSYQSCVAGYDPARDGAGSDEHVRYLIGIHCLGRASSRDDFERALMASLDVHWEELVRRREAFLDLVPRELMVISDTMTILDSSWLLKRVSKDIDVLMKLRGSPIIPE